MHPAPDLRVPAIALVIAVTILGVDLALVTPRTSLTRENGPIESLQHALLAVTSVIWVLAALRWRRQPEAAPPGQAPVAAALAVLAFLALCREVSWLEVYGVDMHRQLEAIGSVTCVAVLAWLGWRWLLAAGRPARRAAAVLTSRALCMLYASGALLIVADGFEKGGSALQSSSEALEELTELVGYAVLLLAVVLELREASGSPRRVSRRLIGLR
jgi:hypothetical protein